MLVGAGAGSGCAGLTAKDITSDNANAFMVHT